MFIMSTCRGRCIVYEHCKLVKFKVFFFHLFQLGDETFNDVFKDFTHMASENPEKLKRKDNPDQ
jgi:hypothetical protein